MTDELWVTEDDHCPIEVYDSNGDGEPCDREVVGWGWYDGGAHEPTLYRACIHHETDGAAYIANLHDRIDRLEDRDDWQGRALAAEAAADGYRQRAERAENAQREAVRAFQRERGKVVNHEATLAHMQEAAGIALEWYDDGALETGVDIAAYRRLRDWVKGKPAKARDENAALRDAQPAAAPTPHPDAENGSGGHVEGVTGWQRGFDADAVQP